MKCSLCILGLKCKEGHSHGEWLGIGDPQTHHRYKLYGWV